VRPDFGPHFLIATEDEATTGAKSIELDGVEAFAAWADGTHALGPEQLGELHCLVLGRVLDYSVLDSYQIVFTHDEMHGPWLIRIPNEFVRALASLDPEQLASVGERWLAASSGFRFRQAPPEWVQRVGVRLAELARRAVSLHKQMYCEWPSC
jgi:hypothetical protein